MSTTAILKALQKLNFDNTFNPYVDHCPLHDKNSAAKIRRQNLTKILKQAAASELDSLWVARDLGYRGGRRTGLALTDDLHFDQHFARWGIESKRPTQGELVGERTAAVIWQILHKVDTPIFMWNVFPVHPHAEGDPFSNRSHNAMERKAGIEILLKITDYLKPKRLVGIGNDAYKALSTHFPEREIIKARHPSYGGQRDFLETMHALYGC